MMPEPPIDSSHWSAVEAAFDRLVDLPESQWPQALDALANELPPAALTHVRSLLARLAERPGLLDAPAAAGLGFERDVAPGSAIGRWTVQGRLGSGGQSLVLAVGRREGGFEQQAVMKLPRGSSFDRDSARRLLQERQVLARLQHPGLPAVLDGGVLPDGSPWLVIERVHGEPIDRYCERHGLGLAARLRLIVQVAEVLAAAHAQLVLHRDIKPGNVLVEDGGRAVLLDFGVAQSLDQEASRTAAGYTLSYAAPEQIRGERGTVATDLYGLGALALKLCSGRAPFEGLETAAQVQAVLGGDPPLPAGLDSDLAAILATCLRPLPAQRYASAEALRLDLLAWLEGRPVRARAGGRRYVFGKFLRRHALAVGASAAAVLLLAGATGVALQQAAQSERARLQAVAAQGQAERSAQRALSINSLFNEALAELGRIEQHDEQIDPEALLAFVEERAAQPGLLPDARADVLNQLAVVHNSAGRVEHSLALLDRSQALWESLPADHRERSFEVATWRLRAQHLRWAQRPVEALVAADRALVLLSEMDEAANVLQLSEVQDSRASLLIDTGRIEEGLQQRRATLALVDRHGEATRQRMFYAASNLAVDLIRSGYEDEGIDLLRARIEALDPVAAAAFPQGPAILMVQLARALRLRGEHAEALDWYVRGIELREQHHDPRHFTFLHGRGERLVFELEAGRPAHEVLLGLNALLDQFEQAGHTQAITVASLQAWRARAAAETGDAAQARTALDAATAALISLPDGQQNQPMPWLQVVQAAQALGERQALADSLLSLQSVLERFHRPSHPLLSAARARSDALAGRQTETRQTCDLLGQSLVREHSYLSLGCPLR
ncbi:MAG: serine/threonine protein kinase [Aquimonas sp.]|nr:serine/threonine protein kinase [Aquimonas sp.]